MFRSPRRKTAVTLSLLEQVAQCVNLIAFITSNAIAVQRTCDVLSPFSIWGSFVQCVVGAMGPVSSTLSLSSHGLGNQLLRT